MQPSIQEGWEGPHHVLTVGYFAEDENEVVCTHAFTDQAGAQECLEALKEEEAERLVSNTDLLREDLEDDEAP